MRVEEGAGTWQHAAAGGFGVDLGGNFSNIDSSVGGAMGDPGKAKAEAGGTKAVYELCYSS